jgi:hypothetical protein
LTLFLPAFLAHKIFAVQADDKLAF